MKLTLKMLAAVALTAATTGCSSFLDINNNPNSLTTANPPIPSAVLAQALNATATNYTGGNPSYNSYASFAGGYWAKSGDVSGFAEERTYNYTSNYYQDLWGATYDNLNDYNYIQQQGTNNNYAYHAEISRIMKVYNFLLLVDQYGDVPYTQALKGKDNLTPVYDSAESIYRDLVLQLQTVVTDISATQKAAGQQGSTIIAVGSEDIVFAGSMANWKRFANSLQLRILLRMSSTGDAARNAYVQAQLATLQGATDGFITTDVVANPGYLQSGSQQNPLYTRYGLTAAGTSPAERFYILPTTDILSKYAAGTDPRRALLYTQISGRFVGADLGSTNPPLSNAASLLLRGSPTVAAGLLKGFNAPTVLMLVSEHLFNKAEVETRGLATGGLFSGGDATAKTDFNNAVFASFLYTFRLSITPAAAITATSYTGASTSTALGAPQYVTYTTAAANVANPLINYDAAVTAGSQVNAILFQKYLAENTIASTEGLDDVRRTGQPAIKLSTQRGSNPLPSRLLYPQTERNTNGGNVPTAPNQFTKIFWQL